MNELLKALYDNFCEPLPETELKKEIKDSHQRLIETLDKPERRLALQIIDDKAKSAKDRSIYSFIVGFRLAWQISNELNMYEKTRPRKKEEIRGGY